MEKINKDGTIVVSNSNYSGTRFFTKTLSPKNNWYIGAGLTFQGFIYPPVTFTAEKPKSSFTVKNADYPVSIKKGHYFTIQGKVTSALAMTKAQVAVLDEKQTKYIYRYEKTLKKVKSFNIHDADQTMTFRLLKKGTYTYRVMVWDSNGFHTVLKKTFKVK